MTTGTDVPAPRSVMEVQVGKKTYPMHSHPTCRTCQSPRRLDIEHRILSGGSYVGIADWLGAQPDADDGRLPAPGTESLRAHAKSHMPLPGSMARAIIDRRAEEIGNRLDAGEAADHIALARLVVKIGMEGLADGTLTPELPDVMNAAKFLAVHDVQDTGIDVAAWRETLMAYMEVARTFIPAAQWPSFGTALSAHPVLRALAAGPAPQLPANGKDTP